MGIVRMEYKTMVKRVLEAKVYIRKNWNKRIQKIG